MNFVRLAFVAFCFLTVQGAANAAGGGAHPDGPEGGFEFEGPFGKFEMHSVQRGYQVYKEVCASCHSMKLLSYRNLGEVGGPFYDPDYPNANDNPLIKAFAAEDIIVDTIPDEYGDYPLRPARPSDAFRSPYPNDSAAAAANNGAIPPDLSVITKARAGGADYIYDLVRGYPSNDAISYVGDETLIDPTKVSGSGIYLESQVSSRPSDVGDLIQPIGQYYNPYMPGDTVANYTGDPRHPPKGGFLAMAPQLTDGRVEYLDGTAATVDQMAYDVAQFLAWASDPKVTNRKSLGLSVMLYLLGLSIIVWFSYRKIWRNIKH